MGVVAVAILGVYLIWLEADAVISWLKDTLIGLAVMLGLYLSCIILIGLHKDNENSQKLTSLSLVPKYCFYINDKTFSILEIPTLLLCIPLILALFEMPKGLYTFLHYGVFIIFAIWCKLIIKKYLASAIICGVTAIIFQPFIDFPFNKEIWRHIDIILAILIIVAVFSGYSNRVWTSIFYTSKIDNID